MYSEMSLSSGQRLSREGYELGTRNSGRGTEEADAEERTRKTEVKSISRAKSAKHAEEHKEGQTSEYR